MDFREKARTVHESGLYSHTARIVELAAKRVGVAADAELHYDQIGAACNIISKVVPHFPPQSGPSRSVSAC